MNESITITTLDEYKEYLDEVAESNQKVANASAKLLRSDKNIETVMADTSLTEQEFIEIIALCRQVNYNRSIGGANKAAENETDRLYAKNPWKFVEEFLQNADDCNYNAIPEISIIIDERQKEQCSIEFCYNEEGFTRNDIWAITAFSESTKVNDTVKIQAEEGVFYREKTGRKGKGFKSVFSLSAENVIVHIRSKGFSFKLDNNIGRIMPIWEDDPKRMDGKTHVIVELIRPDFSTRDIYPEFRRLFCIDNYEGIFASSPFLFMHRLRMVYVTRKNENGEETFITEYLEYKERTKYNNQISLSNGKEVLAGIAKDGIYYREQIQEGVITTLTGDDVSFDIPIIRYTRMVEDDEAYRNYSVIAPVIKSDTGTKWQGGALFRTFPMSLHPIKMPMAIDAPFILNPDRSGIQYSPYKDEEGQQIGANTWNTEVANRLFEEGGVFESFFLWLRTLEGIRIDCYMNQESIMLFEDRKKKINVTYDTLKKCRENVLLYFLNESNGLLSTDSYAGICDEIQKNQVYWARNDLSATEILIRSVAGSTEVLKSKESKSLSIRIEDVLSHCLEDCIIRIGQKNAVKKLVITNEGFFDVIPDEEIIPRLSLLKYDTGKTQITYYKGNLACFGGKKIYLRDIKGGNVYLKCDAEGDYNTALEECVRKRFDVDALKYIDEMEQQYKDVREQIIVPFFNRTGHDLSRTYNEIERRFHDYDKKQIIGILSWFRSQGYTNALGNGNINNEKEIEDDYRDNPWKFVYEFIQNVDDCSFTNKNPELQITISKTDNQIVFEYNEDGFTLEDVKALTKFGDSNKSGVLDDLSVQSGVFDREKTGRKGRGFKSVFALPGDGIVVHVLSNGFSFKFVKRLGSIIPIWEEAVDAPVIGTRITVEGLIDGYADMLIPEIKKLFGVNDLPRNA